MAVRYDAKAKKWFSDTRNVYGKRQRKWFARKGDATQFEALQKLQNPRSRNRPSRSTLTVGSWLKEWTRLREGEVAGETLRLYGVVLARVLPIVGDLPLQSFSKADYRACLLKLRENGLSDNTVETTRKVLKVAFRHAVADDLIASDPTVEATRRRQRQQTEKVRALTVEEAQRFAKEADALPDHDRAVVLTLLLAGLRKGELLGLRPSDVDFTAGALRVEQAASREDLIKDAKTGAGRRAVPLSSTLAEALRRIPLDGPFAFWPETERNRKGVGTMQSRVTRVVQEVGKRCSLDVNPHGLRHTFCAVLVASGVNLYAVSKWAGHGNIAVTVKVYGSWLPPEGSEALDDYALRLLPTTARKPANSRGAEQPGEDLDIAKSAS